MTYSRPARNILTLSIATPETFGPFGQVVMPMEDGLPFGPADAQLDLSGGIPRFYSMRLDNRGNVFGSITRHCNVTQCLGSMMSTPWMLAVAAPAPESAVPDMRTLAAFLIPGDRFVQLHKGTWHAGPYFAATSALFYNLELSDTNVVDHETCNLRQTFGMEFEFSVERPEGA